MNIAIAALLGGISEKVGLAGKLSAETFGLTFENRLAQPEPAELTLSSLSLPAGLADVLADAAVLPVGNKAAEDGESERDNDNLVPDAAFMSSDGVMNPVSTPWQIQQLVTQNARPAEADSKGGAGKELLAPVALNMRSRPDMQPLVRHPGVAESEGEATDFPNAGSLNVASLRGTTEAAVTASDALSPDTPFTHSAAVVRSSPVQSTPIPHSVRVTELPDTPQWKQAVSQHIAIFSREGIHNASIHLHPEELGSLQISLRVHQEQAHIHIVSEHALVRQAMEHALPQLRAAMAESGLQLSQASVGAEGSFAGTGAQGEHPPGQQPQGQSSDDNVMEEEMAAPTVSGAGMQYGINTFV